MKTTTLTTIMSSGLLLLGCNGETSTQQYSRGIGLYPGSPDENFAPEMVADNTYRNVAELRAAYHSSSYDYNLTAQLATDGIVSETEPASLRLSTQAGDIPRNAREYLFDGKPDSKFAVEGNDIFLQVDLNNMEFPIDRFVLKGDVQIDESKARGYEIIAYASNDGENWEEIGREKGSGYIGGELPQRRASEGGRSQAAPKPNPSPVVFKYDYKGQPEPADLSSLFNAGVRRIPRPVSYEVKLNGTKTYKHYKVAFRTAAAKDWTFADWNFYKGDEMQYPLPSQYFNSTWQSATAGNEWVYVDLGAAATFDKINLFWVNKAVKGSVQVSDDAKAWKDIAALSGGTDKKDVIDLSPSAKGRYVRLVLTEAAGNKPYALSEFQVMGKGGLIAKPHKGLAEKDNRLTLSGGNWKLQRASLVQGQGEDISKPGYADLAWIPATVPGTVLSSYINIGAVADPNVADNQSMVSDAYFLSDFWYRNTFTVSHPAEYVFLNFDGINWKADIFLNGSKLGNIEGAFVRGKFDISKQVKKGENVLAVKIIKNAHPGAVKEKNAWTTDQNGGILGADNPTFHASVGWDWIPTIRGRNIGIWNDVFLTFNGAVTVEDPFVRTELPLPDTTSANVFAEVTLKNHAATAVSGILKGAYGEATFEQPVTLQANEEKLLKLDPSTTPALHLKNPKLWWPKGYGEPHLYDVSFRFETDGKVTDQTAFKSGVRQMTYDENEYLPSGGMQYTVYGEVLPHRLSIYINGRRFVGLGGNWGFSESNLNYRAREYDIAVAYHADMNFTMIRNWVGQVGDMEFYEACDRYGIMVWQDFWLANPFDGPDPYYEDMFNKNSLDYVKRIRNYPCIAIYVGRNEGDPPHKVDAYLKEMVPKEHPGIFYIPNSASGTVSGGGPYRALPPIDYFRIYGHDKFHSERGMPNVMNYEDMVRAFGEEHLEPVNTMATPNNMYGMHDYTLGGGRGASAQATESFNERLAKAFGKPKNAKEFADRAQWINYEGYRAMYEGRSEHRRGLLIWMSHPTWPSMVWQTYDYYLDPTGGYFGAKKGAEPLHIQWNPLRDDIEVVNYHSRAQKGLTAKAQLFDQNGKMQWEKELTLDILDDQTVACFPLEQPEALTPTYFIKLALTQNGNVISENFYIRGKEPYNYQSLNQLPKTKLTTTTTVDKEGKEWHIRMTLKNDTETPALIIRLKAEGSRTKEMILPAFYGDNYFSLMPGEEKTVTIRLYDMDTRGEEPVIAVSGFNL